MGLCADEGGCPLAVAIAPPLQSENERLKAGVVLISGISALGAASRDRQPLGAYKWTEIHQVRLMHGKAV